MKLLFKPKSKCCKDNPRCKRCPVVCKRLVKSGFAEPAGKGKILILPHTTKRDVKAARARG
jgi:hypothetical protein